MAVAMTSEVNSAGFLRKDAGGAFHVSCLQSEVNSEDLNPVDCHNSRQLYSEAMIPRLC